MAKKIAIMQPYIFPYLGYFQLVHAVENFIFLDDVNFIKKGYIHRNEIPVGESNYRFSIPLKKKSQNKLINETYIHDEKYRIWKKDFLKTIDSNYSSAPYFSPVKELINDVLYSEGSKISDLSAKSVERTCEYLEIDTNFKFSSNLKHNENATGQSKIINICHTQQADKYYNLKGGIDLYDTEVFSKNQLSLNFIKIKNIEYQRNNTTQHPYISILDLLMFQDKEQIHQLLNAYEIF